MREGGDTLFVVNLDVGSFIGRLAGWLAGCRGVQSLPLDSVADVKRTELALFKSLTINTESSRDIPPRKEASCETKRNSLLRDQLRTTYHVVERLSSSSERCGEDRTSHTTSIFISEEGMEHFSKRFAERFREKRLALRT